jgi:hypothetical protein
LIELGAHAGDIDAAIALALGAIDLAIDAIEIALAVGVHIDADGEAAGALGDDAVNEALAETLAGRDASTCGAGLQVGNHRVYPVTEKWQNWAKSFSKQRGVTGLPRQAAAPRATAMGVM